jgi:capsular polysaccharide export protein
MIPASRPIAHIPHLAAFLEGQGEALLAGGGSVRARARGIAAKKGLPWLLLEDGFLRSVALMDTSVSLVVNGKGCRLLKGENAVESHNHSSF